MCGIAGIFAYGEAAPPVDEEELLRIREAMIRRGPDGKGLWMSSDGRAGLAHRRLAIIDAGEGGAQPMTTAGARYRITFNGEIYNYRELRKGLQAKGCVFRSNSDTEVLLHLYEERGQEMVHALRGMFAFGIFDSVDQTLFVARDPFGIKPLYFADDGKSFRFASQVKALLKGGAIDASPSAAGHVGFYLWGHLPEPHTLFKGIKALEAGSTMLVGASGSKPFSPGIPRKTARGFEGQRPPSPHSGCAGWGVPFFRARFGDDYRFGDRSFPERVTHFYAWIQ